MPHQASTLRSLWLFLPELVMSGAIVVMLLARLMSVDRLIPTHWIALFGGMSAFAIVLFQFSDLTSSTRCPTELFTGLRYMTHFPSFSVGF